jgi:thioredoxin 1
VRKVSGNRAIWGVALAVTVVALGLWVPTPMASAQASGASTAKATGQSTGPATGQTSARHAAAKSSFEPLERWKEAVLSGNPSMIASLYSTNPPAVVATQAGQVGSSQDVTYWSGMKAAGLIGLDPKILVRDITPQGINHLVLRIYLTVQTSSGPQDFVIGASQYWAQQGGSWVIMATQRRDPGPRPKLTLPEPAVPNTNLYPDPSEARKEIDEALAAAKLDRKNVILVFGGNWCFDCHVLDDAFRTDPSIAPIVKRNYHVVHVNIGDDVNDKNQDLAQKYGVVLAKGVPALAVLDSNGKLLTSQKQGEFESAVKIGPKDVTAFLNKWKPVHGPSAASAKPASSPSS